MKTKQMKVRYSHRSWGTFPEHKSSTSPCISMEGKWLDSIGFHIGEQVQVDYEDGMIRIYPLPKDSSTSMVAEATSYQVSSK